MKGGGVGYKRMTWQKSFSSQTLTRLQPHLLLLPISISKEQEASAKSSRFQYSVYILLYYYYYSTTLILCSPTGSYGLYGSPRRRRPVLKVPVLPFPRSRCWTKTSQGRNGKIIFFWRTWEWIKIQRVWLIQLHGIEMIQCIRFQEHLMSSCSAQFPTLLDIVYNSRVNTRKCINVSHQKLWR